MKNEISANTTVDQRYGPIAARTQTKKIKMLGKRRVRGRKEDIEDRENCYDEREILFA